MSLYIDMKMIQSANFSCRIVLSSIVLWISRSDCSVVCLGNFSTWTRLVLHRYDRIHDIEDAARTTQFCPSKSLPWILSNFAKTKYRIWETVYRCCPQLDSSVVQQSTSQLWNCIAIHCRYPISNLDFDPGSISVKSRTIGCSSWSPCSWWYGNSLDTLVQDVPLPSLSRTWMFFRSPCWRRSQAYRLPVDDQDVVVTWPTQFRDIVTLWWDNLVPMGLLFVSAASFPCTGLRIYIRLAHMRTRCCVRFPCTSEIQIWTFCFECHRIVRCTRTPALLETDQQSSTRNSVENLWKFLCLFVRLSLNSLQSGNIAIRSHWLCWYFCAFFSWIPNGLICCTSAFRQSSKYSLHCSFQQSTVREHVHL